MQSRQKYCWICSKKWQRHRHDSIFCKRCDLTTILTGENAHKSLNQQQCISRHLQPGPGENVAYPQTLSMLEFCFWSVYKATGVLLLELCLEFSPYLKERHQSMFYLAVIKPVMLYLSPMWVGLPFKCACIVMVWHHSILVKGDCWKVKQSELEKNYWAKCSVLSLPFSLIKGELYY